MTSIFLILPILVLFLSPKKLRTLGRMVLAFLIVVLAITVPAALVHRGDPKMVGAAAGAVSLSVAALVGWLDIRSVKRAAQQTESSSPRP